jgi:hypothetical protein
MATESCKFYYQLNIRNYFMQEENKVETPVEETPASATDAPAEGSVTTAPVTE